MMTWIEITATLFGFTCVVLTIRRNVWCWPAGLVQVLLFILVFYHAKLFSDLLLHVIYVVLQFYGWFCWTAGRKDVQQSQIMIASLATRQLVGWCILAAAGTLVLGFVMNTWTDASLPYADAFTTVASLIAQYLLAHKFIENWMFWIVVDVVAIGIYFYKELIPTSTLYLAFLGLAIVGLVSWYRQLRRQAPQGILR